MTEKEAIKQLEFDREMILFDPLTGETIEPEMLKLINEDNYKTYIADEMAIKALEEIQQYREIGTVEECREAVEKQKLKKLTKGRNGSLCCKCGLVLQVGNKRKALYFCHNCGQAIDWSEED